MSHILSSIFMRLIVNFPVLRYPEMGFDALRFFKRRTLRRAITAKIIPDMKIHLGPFGKIIIASHPGGLLNI